MRGNATDPSAPSESSKSASRSSFQRIPWNEATSSFVSSSSCPAVEEVRELGERRAAAEARVKTAQAEKDESEAKKRATAEKLSLAENELKLLLRFPNYFYLFFFFSQLQPNSLFFLVFPF